MAMLQKSRNHLYINVLEILGALKKSCLAVHFLLVVTRQFDRITHCFGWALMHHRKRHKNRSEQRSFPPQFLR